MFISKRKSNSVYTNPCMMSGDCKSMYCKHEWEVGEKAAPYYGRDIVLPGGGRICLVKRVNRLVFISAYEYISGR